MASRQRAGRARGAGGTGSGARQAAGAAEAARTGGNGAATGAANGAAGITGSGRGNQALEAVKAELRKSTIGADVLNRMEQGGARVDVLSDAEFRRRYPGAAGVFLPSRDQIIMPESGLRDAQRAALTLAHEGIHWLQDRVGNAQLAQSGGPLGDAIAGARAFGTGRGAKDQANHDEAQSYVLESMIAKELGTRDRGFGTDRRTGETRSFDATLQAIRNSPFYNPKD